MASKKTTSKEGRAASQPRTRQKQTRQGGRRGDREESGAQPAPAEAAAPTAPTGRVVVEREIGGRTLTIETGRMAKLADGACVVRYGDTMVLASAQSAKAPDGIDFFPLTVDYREKTAAAGLIPGGFFKREGRPTTKEILGCRIIDRSIRPMFPDGFRREVQVLSQVLSTDRENDPDVIAAIASFAALAVSSIPHGRSLGMCRIGYLKDKLVVNPLWSQLQGADNRLNLTVAGHKDAIVMVEAGAKEVTEEVMLEALELGQQTAREIADAIDELCRKAGKPKMEFKPNSLPQAVKDAIEGKFGELLRSAPLTPGNKQARSAATKAVKEQVLAAFPAPAGSSDVETKVYNTALAEFVGDTIKDGERQSILRGRRADGRDTTTIRPISIEVGVLPRVHGSVLFTRGETQALGICTLGGVDDQQIIDGLMPEPRKRFLLHYSFPPFSVGETKRVLAPGRREIGHGALAERGVEPVLPGKEEFPYTIRITSEILESNGSSSMATVCAATLSMMDAGVKIKQPVAGVAMGLVMEGRKYAILSDILGSEDGCGDMDFKVVGTQYGITALQMDIKCEGLTRAIMAEALEQARLGRLHVLKKMLEVLRQPRAQLSPNAPRLESVKIPADKIGLVIGPAGRNIRQLQEDFECKIAIEDGGLCTITGVNAEKVMACVEHLKSMTAEIELGTVYEGRVTGIKEFGAFVEILPGQEGLCHVSELSDQFLRSVTDAVKIGDKIKVKVIAIDDFGKVKLSRKAVLLGERGGAEVAEAAPAGERPREDRGRGRFGDREERHPRGEHRERGPRRELGDERPASEERAERPRSDRGWDDGGRPERRGRPDRDERREGDWRREGRGERPAGFERPAGQERPAGSERPSGSERDERPARHEREDRPARHEREERPPRGERFDRPEREERGGRRDRFERGSREEMPARGERYDREERGRGERFERDERPGRGERFGGERGGRPEREERGRPERDDRPRFEREERHGRERFGEERRPRGEREERPGRGEREERPARGEREERPARAEREERPVREDRPARGEREERPVREERPARGDREERRERFEGQRERGGRMERGERPEPIERPEGGPPAEREDRGGRGFGAGRERGRGGRPGREDRPRDAGRATPPLAEFEPTEEDLIEVEPTEAPPAPPAAEIGELEPADAFLGDQSRRPRGERGERGERGGRRRRRRD